MNRRFWSAWGALLAFQCLALPSLTLPPQPFAECGTNFLRHAMTAGFWQNLWTTDAGSLAWPNRLVALLWVKSFGPALYPAVAQGTADLFIITACAWINLDRYRALIRDDAVRFAIGLVLGLGFFYDYECFTMINAGYFGIWLCLLLLSEDSQTWGPGRFWVNALGAGLLATTKAYYLTLVPLFLWAGFRAWRKGQKRALAFHGIFLFFSALQACSLAHFAATTPQPLGMPTNHFGTGLFLTNLALHGGSLWRPLLAMTLPGGVQLWAGLNLLFLAALPAFLARYRPSALPFGLGLIWVGTSSLALALHQVPYLDVQPDFLHATWMHQARHRAFFVPLTCGAGLAALALDQAGSAVLRRGVLLLWLAGLVLGLHPVSENYAHPGGRPVWRWSDTLPLLREKEFYVPINPPFWGVAQGLDLLQPEPLSVDGGHADLRRLLWPSGRKPAPTLRAVILDAQLDPRRPIPLYAAYIDTPRGRQAAKNYSRVGDDFQYLVWPEDVHGDAIGLETEGGIAEALSVYAVGKSPHRVGLLVNQQHSPGHRAIALQPDQTLIQSATYNGPGLGGVWLRSADESGAQSPAWRVMLDQRSGKSTLCRLERADPGGWFLFSCLPLATAQDPLSRIRVSLVGSAKNNGCVVIDGPTKSEALSVGGRVLPGTVLMMGLQTIE